MRAGWLAAHGSVDPLPVQGRLPGDGDAHAGQQHHAEPGRPLAAGDLHAAGAAHGARHRRQARHRRRAAGRVRASAIHVLPRGRLGPRVRGPQPALEGAERGGLPAGREQDQLHVQLVLHRRPGHRLLQLGRQPRACRRSRPGLPELGHGRIRLEGLGDDLQDLRRDALRGAPTGDQPVLHHLLEQQAGGRFRCG